MPYREGSTTCAEDGEAATAADAEAKGEPGAMGRGVAPPPAAAREAEPLSTDLRTLAGLRGRAANAVGLAAEPRGCIAQLCGETTPCSALLADPISCRKFGYLDIDSQRTGSAS